MAAARPNRKILAAFFFSAVAVGLSASPLSVGAAAPTAGFAPGPEQMRSDVPEATRFPDIRYPEIGFVSRGKLLDHFEKHGREFGRITSREYLFLAQELRDRPRGEDVLEFARRDDVITRFDRKSGAFLAFNKDLTIRTFFRPNDGEAYFKRQRYREPR